MSDTRHEYKDDVDKFMDHINTIINLRLEADRHSRSISNEWQRVAGTNLRKESDKMLKEAEYTLYELIDNALEVAP